MNKISSLHIVWLVFFVALFHSLWMATVGWYNPIYDEHMFRQAQTAITSYYLGKGGPFFAYETPLLGPPWSIPFELPVYQWIVAKWHLLSGMALDQSGRFISRFFFYATLWPIYSILKTFQVKKMGRIAGMSLFLFSPMYLFWSRTFLIESTVVFFSAAYLAVALQLFSKEKFSWGFAFTTLILGVLAGTVKVTTGFAFFLLAGLAFLIHAKEIFSRRDLIQRKLLEFFFAFIVPGIATIAWVKFTDDQKALNPLADFIRSQSLTTWNFGTLKQRLSGDFWYMIFRSTIHDAIGHRTTWIISILLLPFISTRFRLLALISSMSFILVPLVFTNLHIVHNYYWMANGIFLVFYLSFVMEGLFSSPKKHFEKLGVIFLVATGILCMRQFYHHGYFLQKFVNAAFYDLEKPLSELMTDKDTVLILGADWFPAVPYSIKQRALMIREDAPVGSERFIGALERVKKTEGSLRAFVYCGDTKDPGSPLGKVKTFVPYDTKPYFKGSCTIFKTLN